MEDEIKNIDRLLSRSSIMMNYIIDKDFFEHTINNIMLNNCNIKYQICDIPVRTLSENRPSYLKSLEITICNDKCYLSLVNPESCGEGYYSDGDYIGCERLTFSMLDMLDDIKLEDHFQKEIENRDNNKWEYCLEDRTSFYLLFIRHDAGTRVYNIILARKNRSDGDD